MENQKQSLPMHDGQQDPHAIQDAEIRQRLGRIKNKILVMSGKGGVGKSSVAAYLAAALANRKYRVGLMDVDLHGPSIPRLLGLKGHIQPSGHGNKAKPVSLRSNLQVVSIEALMGEDRDLATIWRGPIKIGVIRQFISDMEWPDLDYLIIDSPPGTGDEPLTIAQTIPDARALIVTTPQEVSLADVRKSINFCRKVNLSILGLVENMSGFKCPHCGQKIDLFNTGGGELTARKENLRFLGSLPIDPDVVRNGDSGNLAFLANDQNPYTIAFSSLVDRVTNVIEAEESLKSKERPAPSPRGTSEDGQLVFAVPTAEGKLCAHFGHCEQFVFVETQNGEIKGTSSRTPPPHEPGVLPKWLHEMGVDIILAGGMGSKAQQLFNQNGIKVLTGAPMDTPESLVNQYLSDCLVTGDNVCDH